MNSSTKLRVSERFPRGMPIAIFLLVAAITALAIYAIERAETDSQAAQIEQTSQTIVSAVERQSSVHASYLRSGAALFTAQPAVEGQLFRRFLSELRLEANYPGLDGIGWGQRYDARDAAALEAKLRAEGQRGFTLYPALGNDPFGIAVVYLQPESERNRRALGYNMYSEPVRRRAMDLALRQSQPVASGKVVLLQEGKPEPGFIIYMPVFAQNGIAPEQKVLRGFVYSPFNAASFIKRALEHEDLRGAGISIYDGRPRPEGLLASTPAANPSGRYRDQDLTVAGRQWTLRLEEPATPTLSKMSMITLLSGLTVATLLLIVARLLTNQAIEDRQAIAWFEEQASIRNSLTRELNHRVKNTLANVLSIIALTRRRATSLEDFAEGLDGRIRALSATHDLLTQSEWGTTPIGDVISAELAPYCEGADQRLEMQGDVVELAPNDALSLGLAVHELATNAAKYGALSRPEGKVRVQWRLIEPTLAEVTWTETGGPEVPATRKRGFGTDLIERIVAHELRSPVQLDFKPEGVNCKLRVPVRQPVSFALRAGTKRG